LKASKETIYRHELRPVIITGADVMEKIFTAPKSEGWPATTRRRWGNCRAGSVICRLSWDFRDIQEGPILWMTMAACCTWWSAVPRRPRLHECVDLVACRFEALGLRAGAALGGYD
jgi:hypothetical protein